MTPQEKTLDLIKKLLTKANDEGCTREEAAMFAAKAAELAAREQLELNEIDWKIRKEGQPIGVYHFGPEEHDYKASSRRTKWMEDLVGAICRSQSCRIILMGGNSYNLVGRKGNVEIAAYLSAFLIRFVMDMSERDYGAYFRQCAREGWVEKAQGFKVSWRNGFVAEVQRRLAELNEQIKVEYASSTALVRLADEGDAVRDWMKDNLALGKASRLSTQTSLNAAGHQQGREAGSRVDVTGRGVNEAPSGRTKQLG